MIFIHKFTIQYQKIFCLICGLLFGLIFAPVFFFPAIFCISGLAYAISHATNKKQAFTFGWIFGFGQFLTSLYWISIATLVYPKYWYVFPFALLLIPAWLAIYIGILATCSWYFKCKRYYIVSFCVLWVIFEYLRSVLFTGFPWNLVAHASAFSIELMQVVYLIGELGLSFILCYVGCLGYFFLAKDYNQKFKLHLIISIFLICGAYIYGLIRLNENPTKLSDIKVRVVQPCIPQEDKFDIKQVIDHLLLHIKLSTDNLNAKANQAMIVIWPENAIMVPYSYIEQMFAKTNIMGNLTILSGGFSFDGGDSYVSLFALKGNGNKIFEYHKEHLVPFGEYIPLKNYLPTEFLGLTDIDYTAGQNNHIFHLEKFNINIRPLVCYESIFAREINRENADVFINVTNDAWYQNSSGPYQHFHMNRFRVIENGVPIIRSANNGISAIIDPVGKIVQYMPINSSGYFDGYIPLKIDNVTLNNDHRYLIMTILLSIVSLITVIYPNKC